MNDMNDMNSASERLDASRARLRDSMRGTRSAGSAWPGRQLPAAVARLAEHAGNEALRPTAERHPLALVGVAMAGGALLVWARPWRTLWRSALVAGLLSQLTARLVAQIPLASVFDAIQDFAARPAPRGGESPAESESNQEGLRRRA